MKNIFTQSNDMISHTSHDVTQYTVRKVQILLHSLSLSSAAVHIDILASAETVGEGYVQQEEENDCPIAGGHHWR